MNEQQSRPSSSGTNARGDYASREEIACRILKLI